MRQGDRSWWARDDLPGPGRVPAMRIVALAETGTPVGAHRRKGSQRGPLARVEGRGDG